MHRRQVLARAGVALSSLAAGCGSLRSVRETEQETVNPAVDGTATPTANPTPPSVGDWHVELDTPETRLGVYADSAVVAEQLSDRTRVRGFDAATGEETYRREFDTAHKLPRYGLGKYRYGSEVVELDGPTIELLDATTGETVWSLDQPGDVLFLEEGTRYVFLGDSEWHTVIVLDTETWTERCRIEISTDLFGYGRGYVLRDAAEETGADGTETDDASSTVGTDRIVCHETENGTRLWTTTLDFDGDRTVHERVGDSIVFSDKFAVECYDFTDGTQRYAVDSDVTLGEPWYSDDRRAYFGNLNGDGDTARIVTFDGEDGELWRRTFDGEAAYPILRDGRLYGLVNGEGQEKTVSLDEQTGDVEWTHHGEFHGSASSGGVYMRRGSRIARIAPDGSIAWQTSLDIDVPDEPGFWREYGESFVAWSQTEFVALDAETGETRQHVEGLGSLDGLAHRYDHGDSLTDTALFDFERYVSAVSL